jgi:ribonucleoside-diphosphate reductase alpha chain
MKRVQEDSYWTLMCPNDVQDCMMCMERSLKKCTPIMKNKGRKTIKAHELWEKILESQIETGTPYMLYKDAANRKSDQKI